jgi:hypothetical protein
LPAKALAKVWQWDNDPRSHDAVFFHRQTLANAQGSPSVIRFDNP